MLGADTSWTPSPPKPKKKEVFQSRSFQVRDFVRRGEETPAARKRVDARQELLEHGDTLGQHVWKAEDKDQAPRSYETRVTTHGAKPSMRYAQETPWPTYSQWGNPRWIDLRTGTQFRMADGTDRANLMARGVITRPEWTPDSETRSGAQLLYLRFPKGGRAIAGQRFPIQGDVLQLLDLETGYLWKATVQFAEGYRKRKAATGNVCVEALEKKVPATRENVERAYTKLPKRYRKKQLLRTTSFRYRKSQFKHTTPRSDSLFS
jgi:hypothetical protein